MRTSIICESVHHGNTFKVTETIALVLGAGLLKPGEIINPSMLEGFDVIGEFSCLARDDWVK